MDGKKRRKPRKIKRERVKNKREKEDYYAMDVSDVGVVTPVADDKKGPRESNKKERQQSETSEKEKRLKKHDLFSMCAAAGTQLLP